MILSVIIALSLEGHIYNDIIKTKSKEELGSLIEVLEKGNLYKTGCIAELAKNQFPTNCIHFLKIIESSKYKDKLGTKKAKSEIKSYCAKKDLVFKLEGGSDLDDSFKKEYPKCFERYSEKLMDIKYKKSKN